MDNDEENPKDVDGVPVIRLTENAGGNLYDLNFSLPVYIGTRGIYQASIISGLREIGFSDFIPVTVDIDIELRNAFVRKYFQDSGRIFRRIDEKSESCCIYVAKSVYDKPLKNDCRLNRWEQYIQAGCALSDDRLSECLCFDNSKDNISSRNRQFCELTALYWIWKNASEEIVGLEHYRRRFTLGDDWLDMLYEKKIDVILPVPLYVHPSLGQNYRQRHTKETWDAMTAVLRERPDIYSDAIDFFENTGCYSPCNMLIARKNVLDDLCRWLFPILFEVAGRMGQLEDVYQNRYPGFLSERLITFFFFYYEDRYKTVYSDKNFLE